jgi:ribonucleoside-diphosphate reductase alpha chain
VGVTEEFMQKVRNNEEWVFKDGSHVQARVIFEQISSSAHYCGEPGIIFLDNFHKDNPVPSVRYTSVAPCAEIGLAPGEVCQFNYINLANMIIEKEPGKFDIDFDSLSSATRLLTRLLDNAVEISIANALASPDVIASKRRIGIGICGFADLLLKLHLPYGSRKSISILSEILSSINYHSKMASVELAQQRGKFPAFHESRYLDPVWRSRFQKYPTSQVSSKMWRALSSMIREHGIRNACTTILPPTSLSSRLLHASQSIEPLFSLLDAEGNLREEVKAEIQMKLNKAKVTPKRQKSIFTAIEKKGCISEDIKEIPLKTKALFAIGCQICWTRHVSTLAKAARYIDESVSKTINLPQCASLETARACFQAAYRHKLKGITIFRDGCLQERQMKKASCTYRH